MKKLFKAIWQIIKKLEKGEQRETTTRHEV